WVWSSAKDTVSWSAHARLLPYLEQGNLFQQAKITTNTLLQSAAATTVKVKVYLCPSDPDQDSTNTPSIRWFPGSDPNAPQMANLNYVACVGADWCWSPYQNCDPLPFSTSTCDPGWGQPEHTNGIFAVNYDTKQGQFEPVNERNLQLRKIADVTD